MIRLLANVRFAIKIVSTARCEFTAYLNVNIKASEVVNSTHHFKLGTYKCQTCNLFNYLSPAAERETWSMIMEVSRWILN